MKTSLLGFKARTTQTIGKIGIPTNSIKLNNTFVGAVMMKRQFRLQNTTKVLFIWDGTLGSIASADVYLSDFQNFSVHAVHALPHKFFRTPGNPENKHQFRASVEESVHMAYAVATENVENLAGSDLQLLFGERIEEVLRVAETTHCDIIMMSGFEQSSFSKGIHGDLNKRVASRANCPVEFLEIEEFTEFVSQNDRAKSLHSL